MPLVPLYDESSADGSSHNVRAPGGYETWRLWAFDGKQDLLLSISLWNGFLLDPDYIKAYRRYCKNPTRVPPPLPGDYTCQEITQYQDGSLLISGALSRIPTIRSFPNPTHAGLEFTLDIGKVRVQPFASSPSLHLTTLNSSHHWHLANPLVRVVGKLQLDVYNFAIDSPGFCDHRYGTSPLNSDYFIDGCVFFPSGILLFQATQTTSWIAQLTQTATTLIDQPVNYEPRRRRFWQDAHPKTIGLGDCATLANPQLVDPEFCRLRVMYEAKSATESGRAFCEIYARMARPLMQFFVPRPRPGFPPITWSPTPPTDKSSPSAHEHAPAPSSSP